MTKDAEKTGKKEKTAAAQGIPLRETELVIIGGGAAGMAAAVKARDEGIKDILVIERSEALGGVLHQCIHNGFGLHRFHKDMTGVEFARTYMDMMEERGIVYMLRTFVIALTENRVLTCVNPEKGVFRIKAGAVILAMGCRERSRNALLIPGTRGAGIITAGTAQRYLNIDGYLAGEKIVILGSGDIGLIMARQFILEGAEVLGVVEIMPWSGGLPRNMKQCIEDFNIPVYYNSTITEIRGRERVTSVQVSRVDRERRPVPGTEFDIPCDTLLISAGLIPENELTEMAGIRMDPGTKGAMVTDDGQTSVRGIFACGNVLHVHDLVDYVSEEGEKTGKEAAMFLRRGGASEEGHRNISGEEWMTVTSGKNAGPVVPQYVRKTAWEEGAVLLFRPKDKLRNAEITASSGGKVLCRNHVPGITPGEMCRIDLRPEDLKQAHGAIRIDIEGEVNR